MWILIRAILMNLLALLGALVAVAVPIGLLVATLYYGFAAFQELWRNGYGVNGPFEARTHFNLLIRAATGLLAFLPAMGASSLVTGRITTERDKKTWDAFLTTPLSGEEILRSKARVAVHWPLAVGMAAPHPLGDRARLRRGAAARGRAGGDRPAAGGLGQRGPGALPGHPAGDDERRVEPVSLEHAGVLRVPHAVALRRARLASRAGASSPPGTSACAGAWCWPAWRSRS